MQLPGMSTSIKLIGFYDWFSRTKDMMTAFTYKFAVRDEFLFLKRKQDLLRKFFVSDNIGLLFESLKILKQSFFQHLAFFRARQFLSGK